MLKRDDAISIKELVKRANSNRTRVYKTIVKGWQKDPVKKDFIFQVEAPGTKTGYAWFIKKPAVQLAIQTLNTLSPAEQESRLRKQEQGIRGYGYKHIDDACDAIGDIIIYLLDYCEARNFDLEKCIELSDKHIDELEAQFSEDIDISDERIKEIIKNADNPCT